MLFKKNRLRLVSLLAVMNDANFYVFKLFCNFSLNISLIYKVPLSNTVFIMCTHLSMAPSVNSYAYIRVDQRSKLYENLDIALKE